MCVDIKHSTRKRRHSDRNRYRQGDELARYVERRGEGKKQGEKKSKMRSRAATFVARGCVRAYGRATAPSTGTVSRSVSTRGGAAFVRQQQQRANAKQQTFSTRTVVGNRRNPRAATEAMLRPVLRNAARPMAIGFSPNTAALIGDLLFCCDEDDDGT